jgi:type VI protein secretion system component VasK
MRLIAPDWTVFVLFLVILVASCIWIFSVLEIAKSRFREPGDKARWMLMTALVPLGGAILYLAFGRKNRIKLN